MASTETAAARGTDGEGARRGGYRPVWGAADATMPRRALSVFWRAALARDCWVIFVFARSFCGTFRAAFFTLSLPCDRLVQAPRRPKRQAMGGLGSALASVGSCSCTRHEHGFTTVPAAHPEEEEQNKEEEEATEGGRFTCGPRCCPALGVFFGVWPSCRPLPEAFPFGVLSVLPTPTLMRGVPCEAAKTRQRRKSHDHTRTHQVMQRGMHTTARGSICDPKVRRGERRDRDRQRKEQNKWFTLPFFGVPFLGVPFLGVPFFGVPFCGTPFFGAAAVFIVLMMSPATNANRQKSPQR